MRIAVSDTQPWVDDAAVTGNAASRDDGVVGGRIGARNTLTVAGLLLAGGGVPLLVALMALRDPRWYPSLDYAMTELRVRDVATSHAPMVGLAGRIHGHGQQGSHPGPVSFWLLWPVPSVARERSNRSLSPSMGSRWGMTSLRGAVGAAG
jgi:hypothetical protein